MRKLALSIAVLALVVAGAPALAHGPSGSDERNGSNQVKCRRGTKTPAAVVYIGTKGVEMCSDGRSLLPIQGRLILATAQGGYVAADGDRSNRREVRGWARVDRRGVRCGDDRGPLDATHPTRRDTSADCG